MIRRPTLPDLVVLLLASGCTAPTTTAPNAEPAASAEPDPLAPAQPSGETRVGIEVRRWFVQADPVRLASAIAAFREDAGEGDAPPRPVDGLVIARGPAGGLPRLLESLGGSRTDLRIWHGQATDWRELEGASLASPVVVMLDGRPRAIADGRLSLQLRGWSQPMEDGAACEVELGLRWRPARRAAVTLDSAEDRPGQWVGRLASLESLGRGEVLVIAPDLPPPQDVGPPVQSPPPIGRLLLAESPGDGVPLLVVWPSLPDWLFPDDPTAAAVPPAP